MYNTKQKNAIMSVLKSNRDKLISAQEILNSLEKDGNHIGKATLYRFLDNLVLTKEIRKSYNTDINGFEYQMTLGDCDSHLHLKCKSCGLVIHLSCNDTKEYLKHISLEHEFLIDQMSSTIYGVCKECQGVM